MVYRGAYKGGRELEPPRMMPLAEAQTLRLHALPLLGDLEGASGSVSAAQVGLLALARLRRGERDEPALVEPLYLRRPEAELLWEKRHGS
jgi:hypothetical protein